MDVSFDLQEEDLHQAQLQLLALRRERLLSSPFLIPGAVALLAPFAWVFRASFWRNPDVVEGTLPGALEVLFILACAGAAVALLLPWLGRFATSRAVDAWSARRLTRAAALQSTFGPVTLTVDETGLVRRNASGERRIAWAQVKEHLSTPQLLTLRIDGGRQVLLLPASAFPGAAAFEAARLQVERLSGKRSLVIDLARGRVVPAPRTVLPAGRRRPHPALWVLLGLALLLFVKDRVNRWYYDPLPRNPEGKVVVYSTAWCPVCSRLRDCLQRAEVPFEERDVDASRQAEAEWSQLGGGGVPVTIVGQRVVYGLNGAELGSALAAAGYQVDCSAAGQTTGPAH
jgi:glutaredoxin